jgi:hypothetical protein
MNNSIRGLAAVLCTVGVRSRPGATVSVLDPPCVVEVSLVEVMTSKQVYDQSTRPLPPSAVVSLLWAILNAGRDSP